MSGRRPLPVVIAAIDVTCQILAQTPNAPSLHLKTLCVQFGVGENTARARAREIKNKILDIARPLPWMKSLSDANILASSRLVLENLNFCKKLNQKSVSNSISISSSPALLQLPGPLGTSFSSLEAILNSEDELDKEYEDDSTSGSLPVSYLRAEAKRNERLQKIQLAKERLRKLCLLEDSSSSLNTDSNEKSESPKISEVVKRSSSSSIMGSGLEPPISTLSKTESEQTKSENFFTPISEIAVKSEIQQSSTPTISSTSTQDDQFDEILSEDRDKVDLLIEKLLLHKVVCIFFFSFFYIYIFFFSIWWIVFEPFFLLFSPIYSNNILLTFLILFYLLA